MTTVEGCAPPSNFFGELAILSFSCWIGHAFTLWCFVVHAFVFNVATTPVSAVDSPAPPSLLPPLPQLPPPPAPLERLPPASDTFGTPHLPTAPGTRQRGRAPGVERVGEGGRT